MTSLGLAYGSSSDSDDETRVDGPMPSTSDKTPEDKMDSTDRLQSISRLDVLGMDTFRPGHKRKVVKRNGLPLFRKLVNDAGSDSEDEPVKRKKVRAEASKREGALGFLPAPVNELPLSAPPETRPREPSSLATDVEPQALSETAEAFRVDLPSAQQIPPHPVAADPDAPAQEAQLSPEELLREALAAQGGGSGGGIELKEVSAAALQHVDAGRRAEMDGVRVALGGEHQRELHAAIEVLGGEPSKRQKQRHQINSLYEKAKLTEIQFMEGRVQGTKSKAESAAKYGW